MLSTSHQRATPKPKEIIQNVELQIFCLIEL